MDGARSPELVKGVAVETATLTPALLSVEDFLPFIFFNLVTTNLLSAWLPQTPLNSELLRNMITKCTLKNTFIQVFGILAPVGKAWERKAQRAVEALMEEASV